MSLHLEVDGSGLYPSALGKLMAEARRDPKNKPLAPDFDRIERFIAGEFTPGAHRLVAVYSSEKHGLFETFTLPQPFKSSISVGASLDLRPLTALGGQYHRFVALLLGPASARFIELHMGRALELETLPGDYAKEAGLKRIASRCAALLKERRYDRLILGAVPELEAVFARLLEPAIQKDLILEPVLGPERPVDAVLERVLHNERQARTVTESVLVHRLLDEARHGGAVTGLEAVAAAVQQGCVSRMLVRDGYAKMGRVCPKCRHLSVDHRSCPWCFRATEMVMDVVSELVARALDSGCEVYRVMHDARFDGVCRVGALLKVPEAQKRAEPPTSRALKGRYATKDGRPSPLRPKA